MDKNSQNKCKSQELKCKIYDVIVQLEDSLKPRGTYRDSNEMKGNNAALKMSHNGEQKKAGCSCSPGCCKASMEYKPPNLSKMMGKSSTSGNSSTPVPPNTPMGHLTWHSENHSYGCFPEKKHYQEGGQSSSLTGQKESHSSPTHRTGQVGEVSPQEVFDLTPEELQQRGCFVARAA